MYEYNSDNNQSQANNQYAISQARENMKAEKKAASKKFWGKIGTALCVGLVFGVVAGSGFACVTRVVDYFFPQNNNDTKIESSIDEHIKPDKEPIEKPKRDDIHQDEPLNITNDSKDDKVFNVVSGMDVSAIVENSMPSIVSITNKSVQEIMSMWGMGVQQYESTSAGSGIIVGKNDEELLIVTNNHVVESADTLSVGFINDVMCTAYVKGTDKDLDLAVVAVKLSDIDQETKDAIDIAVIGNSEELKVGEQVVAIGNALGYGQSVTTGIVSALNRDITKDNIDNPLIQTDAAINPGNSGGALLNMSGELIGINSAKISSTSIEGVGYAIPITSALPIMESLMNREVREEVAPEEAGYIGISGVAVDYNTSKAYGIPQGVYIQSVEENSPAEDAGLIKSDVVKKFDGVTVSSISEIREMLDYYKAGEKVDFIVSRLVDGEYVDKTITITLGSREGTPLDPKNQQTTDEEKTEDSVEDEESSESEDKESEYNRQKQFQFEFNGDLNDIFGQLFGR